ncbi:Uncharacterised protein [Serratia rubidaea]|uniref:Uncharacterized protein n=1 Tax=Serratia rubidaea TaxID=61652 RepID=A0A4U9H7V2_SERRU|nr:hypothetical protein [Serratia rubidaea]QPR65090.1 hypothetical protein I6G83_07560 [Serratia rubidaea]CAI0979638.1 Uncharacterised protein [Serratia rubidaea]CAI1786779.1 Uncharacterised protein [Serratia rubidaea]VTP59710.1 Uncharacterised protein [Serratia rubidaea]HAY0637880.1 hypothetical protein [Serratia rubidaea]
MALLEIPPSVARTELGNMFSSNPAMLLQINAMRDSLVVVLCSLLRGDRLTTAGNNVPADYEVLRLSAAIEDLEKKYFIPIQHRNVSTVSVVAGGKKTNQMYYDMDKDVIARLQSDPEPVLREQRKDLSSKEWMRKQKKLDDLLKNHGGVTETFLTLVHHAYKDKPLSNEKWAELEAKFRDLLNGLDAA